MQICLLADLKQAKYPAMPQDEADIAAMTREIRRLNHYCPGSFVLAVRPRTFSPTMQSYSGWERKRGAITQLVRLIRGQEGEFLALEGDIDRLRRTKYLLALDSDTDMRMDTVSQLVGAALHPCNRPVIDPITQRVVARLRHSHPPDGGYLGFRRPHPLFPRDGGAGGDHCLRRGGGRFVYGRV